MTSNPESPEKGTSSGVLDIGLDSTSPKINKDVFKKIENEDEFGALIAREFDSYSRHANLSLQYSTDLLHDAYQSYQWDVKRLTENMPDSPSPDHFKLSGCLAYWLRRNSPIASWEIIDSNHKISAEKQKSRDFLYNYGRVYHPFMLGYRICWFFEYHKQGAAKRRIPDSLDSDYVHTICYFMKHKSVSPHALGLIYRSLFLA